MFDILATYEVLDIWPFFQLCTGNEGSVRGVRESVFCLGFDILATPEDLHVGPYYQP